MAKIVLDPVTNGATLSTLNANFDKIEAELQNRVAYRDNVSGETNTIKNDMDHDGNDIFNVNTIEIQDLVVQGVDVPGSDLASIPELRQDVATLQSEMVAINTEVDILTNTVNVNAALEDQHNKASLRTSGAPINPISEIGDRAGKFLAFDAVGQPVSSFGTGADLGLRVDLANSTGAQLIGFLQSGVGSVVRTLQEKARESVSVMDFGAVGDGVVDDTASIILANTFSLDLVFPPGKIFTLQNWEPREGTRVHARGTTIRRPANTLFGATGSSSSVIITNDNIEVMGGKWDAFAGGQNTTWTGSFLLNGGNNFTLVNAEISNSWGGIFGHELQNGSLVSNNVRVMGCWIHHCSHNTYFADIDGLMFNNNLTEFSLRDGIRTYRNCLNIEVVGNISRNNGNGTVGQSQDGIDVYIAGKRCLITNNFLFGNSVRGIDAKRVTTDAETNFDTEYLISNNYCFDNGDMGITIDGQNNTVLIKNVLVTGNHVFNNGQYGVILKNCSKAVVTSNIVYLNGLDGIRVESCVDPLVSNNNIYSNGTLLNSGQQNGIYSSGGTTGSVITGNIVRADGASQITGIFVDNGKCYNNSSSGHSSADYSSTGNMTVTGKRMVGKFGNNTTTQLLAITEKGQVCGLRTLMNNTATSIDMIIQKRSATTGAASGTFSNESGVNVPTAWVSQNRALSASGAIRSISGGEAITITLLNITSGFTDGVVEVHYID